LGVDVCYGPEGLAASGDIVLMCVSADSDVLAVVDAIARTIKQSAVIDISTVSSAPAQRAAARMGRYLVESKARKMAV
jgi:3-hydroxyisobutyrate dehydrogenase